ncbi:hypothetical protein LSUE1_G002175 [Lachnellula suecica]|uniref:Rhodopsin domain-containing protein n=1 Tax=Lachnellula suecica TaxID=602035 RepID=A0A8T9CAB2_9HELO|nr:hypothetical protein LSUE1_G002175 [Lachnellula suecica]
MSYGGNTNRGPFLNVINWVFNAIALVTVILRLASHYLREKGRWTNDDAFIILAMVSVVWSLHLKTGQMLNQLLQQAANLARTIYVNVCISMGFGKHLLPMLEEDPVHATKLLRLLVILQAIGLWTFTLPKLPVVALLVNLFGKNNRKIAYILYSAVGGLVLLVFIMTITTFVQCDPVSANWTLKGKCWPKYVNVDLGYLAGSYSAFLDFALALYPILQISRLQMERGKKIVLACSLSLGFLACITTIYKLTTISSILDVGDPTWATVPLEVWNSVEGTTLIMAASIPLTRPLMVFVAHGFRDLTYRLTGNSSASRSAKSTGVSNRSGTGHGYSSHRRLPSDGQGRPLNSRDDILLRSQGYPADDDLESNNSHHQINSGIYKTVDVQVNRTDR